MLSDISRIAASRFGLGCRPADEATALAHDPKAWLKSQIQSPGTVARSPLPAAAVSLIKARVADQMGGSKDKTAINAAQKEARQGIQRAIYDRVVSGATTETPFRERLVYFWANHFTVAVKNPLTAAILPAYEQNAIRPYVTGHFEAMLLAVAQSPAMLLYLDNANSIGPNSPAGKRRGKNINENLAREILELHTLGVNGGYTQDDVIALAKLITGWSIELTTGEYRFRNRTHEPGPVTLLGITYPDPGTEEGRQERGRQALRDLARHPSTAQFLATKLARHFIADDPPAEAIDALARSYRQSGGNLRSVYETLVDLPQPWQTETRKFKSNMELVVSALRLSGTDGDIRPEFLKASFAELGDLPFTADSPAGFPDTAREMLGSDLLMRRINWAAFAAPRLEFALAPEDAMQLALGDTIHDQTRKLITRAGDRKSAYAALLASPEFQWR